MNSKLEEAETKLLVRFVSAFFLVGLPNEKEGK
jgi:hypothetical protein